jgi:hypothetical protein
MEIVVYALDVHLGALYVLVLRDGESLHRALLFLRVNAPELLAARYGGTPDEYSAVVVGHLRGRRYPFRGDE